MAITLLGPGGRAGNSRKVTCATFKTTRSGHLKFRNGGNLTDIKQFLECSKEFPPLDELGFLLSPNRSCTVLFLAELGVAESFQRSLLWHWIKRMRVAPPIVLTEPA